MFVLTQMQVVSADTWPAAITSSVELNSVCRPEEAPNEKTVYSTFASAAVALSIVMARARSLAGAVIAVTTVQQKISSTGGCSLQEAI